MPVSQTGSICTSVPNAFAASSAFFKPAMTIGPPVRGLEPSEAKAAAMSAPVTEINRLSLFLR